ncbi:Crp/Fnr family transcriptional regulator [Altererythrobacter sp.]|nr:Crp/Fnr family transcriptional regulator [Altererythrobacter sp.]
MQNLLAKYGRISSLNAEEERALRDLTSSKRSYGKGQALVCDDEDDTDKLFIVEKGRLFASIDLPSGERAITRLYYSGDIVGTANIPFEKATQTITVNEPTELYIFPRRNLVDAFVDMPRIAAVFYTFAALENAILNDRLVSVGRTQGQARLASLILEIDARRNLTRGTIQETVRLGLTQAQIGDAIGLTEVQVSRLFKGLTDSGLVERHGQHIRILDRLGLTRIGNFTDRYQDLDMDWFETTMQHISESS